MAKKVKMKPKPKQRPVPISYQGQTPNILLIIGDDFAQAEVDISGEGDKRTMEVHTRSDFSLGIFPPVVDIKGALPNLSRFLRNGLYFSQAWAQPACSTTRASIYTGLHPWKNGVGSPPGLLDSTKGFETLPMLLSKYNYVSGLFGKWHLGETTGYLPTDHGWHKHVGTLGGVLTDRPHNSYTDWFIQDSDDAGYGSGLPTYEGQHCNGDYATLVTVKKAAEWINEQSTPWFATIAFHSPHAPFHVPPDGYDPATAGKPDNLMELLKGGAGTFLDEYKDYKFNIMAQNMDYNIGRLLGTSGAKGDPDYFESISEYQLSNTIIIFIGDNGSAQDVALAEAKNHIYEGSVRVPMIIADGRAVLHEFKGLSTKPRYLHSSRPNATCDQLAHVVDLYQTIVRLVNPDAVGFPLITDSVDFSDLLTDEASILANEQKRLYNFSQYYKDKTRRATIRSTGYKLNFDETATTQWSLYRYSDGEIPGREDFSEEIVGAADDLFADALGLADIGAAVNLKYLHKHLQDNYRCDYESKKKTNEFPDL